MPNHRSVRDAASDRGVAFGASVVADRLREEDAYRLRLREEFTTITTASALKMGPLRPGPGKFDFRDADAIARFADVHDLGLRGHTLVWHRQQPEWLEPWTRSDDDLRRILRDHVRTVVGRYRGRVDTWDVVNEAIADDFGMRESPWYDAMGEEYLDFAFRWANEVDPDADLYYNDYEQGGGVDTAELDEKVDAMYDLVAGLVDRDVPIDGVGFQGHAFDPDDRPSPAEMAAAVERFADLGLDVQVTEIDVPIREDLDEQAAFADQADYYRDLLAACLDAGVETFVTWGVADHNSWLERLGTGTKPLLFDDNYESKPARDAVVAALEN